MIKFKIDEESMVFKTLLRIGYILFLVLIWIVLIAFLGDEYPRWVDIIIQVILIGYLLFGMLISHVYQIPIFNHHLSSWVDKDYKLELIDYIVPSIFIFIVMIGPSL